MERQVGRAFVGPADREPDRRPPREDWARVYWLFEQEFGLRPQVVPVGRPGRWTGTPRQR